MMIPLHEPHPSLRLEQQTERRAQWLDRCHERFATGRLSQAGDTKGRGRGSCSEGSSQLYLRPPPAIYGSAPHQPAAVV